MNFRWIMSILIFVFLTGVLLFFLLFQTKVETKVDTSAINDVVKKVEQSGGRLEQGLFSDRKYEFSLLNNHGKLVFTTEADEHHSINEAIQNRDTIVDVLLEKGNQGKLIFYNGNTESLFLLKNRLAAIVLVAFTVFTALGAIYSLYIYRAIIRPFEKLQTFAKNIARGHLNVPLEMDRNHLFGAFTESFDMMREELEKAKNNEYKANKSKQELVASLSHDIKTPVASIKAVSEFMLVMIKEEKLKKQLQTIYSKAEQIDRLVTDMFLAALEDLEELKVQVTEESSKILYEIIESTNFYGKIRINHVPDCVIAVDVIRLQQIFDNIISNSYKYADTAIDISFRLTATHLEVEIKDYGKGTAEEEIPLLCTKFYRGQNAEGKNGSGLGLYISSYLMNKMDGDIDCSNTSDGFCVILGIKLA